MTGIKEKSILIEQRGAVALLTLNRAKALNAINDSIRHGLSEALRNVDEDPAVGAIVIVGAGERGFSVGADIKEIRSHDSPIATRRRLIPTSWIEVLDSTRKPVIAAIHGFCLGGGMELALACDLRVVAIGSEFALPETTLGLIPGGGGTQRLPRLIGLSRALDLLLTGERIDADEAFRIGIANRLAESSSEALAEALRIAEVLSTRPRAAISYVKEAARAGLDMDLASGLKLEKSLFALLTSSPDRAEAAAAFRDKRKPIFTGA
ncbi:MAG: enoyl-CoA hydratase/isomerase family protein [Gallionella sp.]|nr:enoyl-CoA hydratase/isomerase family protein [Gallionella sp.]